MSTTTSAIASPFTPVDVRAPRATAGVTAVLALASLALSLFVPAAADGSARLYAPGLVVLAVIAVTFALGAFVGLSANPLSLVFRYLVRPRLGAPTEREDPRPPRFAQLVGFFIATAGVVLAVLGVPGAAAVAAALVFIAAFLNSAVGFCLGCWLYVLLIRAGVVRVSTPLYTP